MSKFIGNLIGKKRSFTLIELLVAVGIFSILLLSAASTFVNFQGAKRRAQLTQYIKNEGEFLMERIKSEIRNGTVDYEEYYHQKYQTDGFYATKYGWYGAQFFHPGNCGPSPDSGVAVPGFEPGRGLRCANSAGICNPNLSYWTTNNPLACAKEAFESKDLNVWQNPYDRPGTAVDALNDNNPGTAVDNFQDELYLLDSSGTKRTILRGVDRLPAAPDGKPNRDLVMLQLVGEDKNSNGIIDTWFCADEYMRIDGKDPAVPAERDTCSAYSMTYKSKGDPFDIPAELPAGANNILTNMPAPENSFFVSITPSRLKVTQLKFFVSPLEDPRKGLSEDLTEVYVTVILTVRPDPNADFTKAIPGDIPEYTMQTTITAGAKNFIRSWHGVLQN